MKRPDRKEIKEWERKFENPNQIISSMINDSILAIMVKLARLITRDFNETSKSMIAGLGKILYKRWKLNEEKLKRTLTQGKKQEIDKNIQQCVEAGFAETSVSSSATNENENSQENKTDDTELESEKPKET